MKEDILNPHSTIPICMDITILKNNMQDIKSLMYNILEMKEDILNPHSTIPICMDITILKNKMEDIKRLMYNILEMKGDTKMTGKLMVLSKVMLRVTMIIS